ncbi:phosphotransferase [Flavitalea sp. BT771]|uniref:phosphotransferase n=1 Tax=Flavitalea sp. BT771 TaxID=3063329 RepID=UPI0026E36379|nr:phosphotransferase [Flavitalea sp. BT771]MDO6433642.1 phosphotransferase [Flavitalea sp. BT771]MDV6222453.1 phosphotransferase [Flavitalea sp. BT771]
MENTLNQLISESRLPAVEAALLQTFRSAAIDKIDLLSGGLSGSAVYKMIVQGRAYVLKLDAPSIHDTHALEETSKAGIAPRLYFREASAGITITDFIESKPIRQVFTPEKLVSELANTIRSIHTLPCHIPGHDLQQTIDGMMNNFLQTKVLAGPIIEECFTHYLAIKQKYPWDDPDKVFSHNDINPGNLLCDGVRLWVIDWDAAFSNDKYIDLATAANFFVQTEEQEVEFLHIYFNGAVDEHKRARFYTMRQISRIIYGILLVQVAVRNKPAGQQLDPEMEGKTLKAFGEKMAAGQLSMATYEGQLMYGKAQMNEAVHQMRSSRFTRELWRL